MARPSIQLQIVNRDIFIGNECIWFVDSVKNLGIILDNILSFESKINNLVNPIQGGLWLDHIKGGGV